MNRKVLIIGIDGGTWKLLTPAMDQGYMPHLKGLLSEGASGILESTLPALTPAAWGSFQTGLNPGANGVFDFSFWDRINKKIQYVSSTSLQPTIWDIASSTGKRVGLINVPMTYPPRKINGCMVTGILTPSLQSNFTYPPELKNELLKEVPDYHIFNLKNIIKDSQHQQIDRFVEQMVTTIESRTRAAKFILNQSAFDIFMVHFQATDVIQHAMWGYLDQTHPMYESEKCKFIFNAFYKTLDQQIQLLREVFEESAGPDYATLIISDHGFETHNKRINLGNWLCQEGFLKLNPQPSRPKLLKRLTKKLGIGQFLKRFISATAVKKMEESLGLSTARFMWRDSQAFSIGRSGEGFLYLLEANASQRQRTASVLIEKLKEIRDPQTNSPVATSIYRKEEIFHGEALDPMPDIVIEPASGYSFTGAYQPNQGLFHKVCSGSDFHIGKHNKEGVIFVAGKHIRPQRSINAHLIDIAPTLLYYLQLPISKALEGRIIQELFTEEFKADNPLPRVPYIAPELKSQQQTIYSDEDEKKIQQRLKDLGYM